MKRFKKVYVEITNICNLSCSFCPKTSRKPQYMSCEDFEKIAAQIAEVTDYVYFHVMGEPLLHAELEKLIKIAKKYDLQVNITTNGTLINSKLACLVQNPIRKISFSLHSYAGNVQNISLDEYVFTILVATQQLKQSTICELRFWDNAAGNATFSAFNMQIFKIIERFYALDFRIAESMSGNKLKLCDNVYIGAENQFEWPNINAEASVGATFCYGLRTQIGVLVDGAVVPCCLDSEGQINLGNILETPLVDILHTQKAVDIYANFSNRIAVEKLCKTCKYAKQRFPQ